MSAFDSELNERVRGFIEAWLGESGGGMVTGFHLIADFVDADGGQSWMYATAPDQKLITTMGLIEWARGVARYEQRMYHETGGD